MAMEGPLPNTVGSLKCIAISPLRLPQGRNTYYTVGKYLQCRLVAVLPKVLEWRMTYPLVKTFSNDVFPHAPSPLSDIR